MNEDKIIVVKETNDNKEERLKSFLESMKKNEGRKQ